MVVVSTFVNRHVVPVRLAISKQARCCFLKTTDNSLGIDLCFDSYTKESEPPVNAKETNF